MFGPCFVIQFFVSVYFCNHLDVEKRATCITLTVFLMSCYVALHRGTVSWSKVVCDCGISWPYPLAFLFEALLKTRDVGCTCKRIEAKTYKHYRTLCKKIKGIAGLLHVCILRFLIS